MGMTWEDPVEVDESGERAMKMKAFFDALVATTGFLVIVCSLIVYAWAVQG